MTDDESQRGGGPRGAPRPARTGATSPGSVWPAPLPVDAVPLVWPEVPLRPGERPSLAAWERWITARHEPAAASFSGGKRKRKKRRRKRTRRTCGCRSRWLTRQHGGCGSLPSLNSRSPTLFFSLHLLGVMGHVRVVFGAFRVVGLCS